LRDRVSLILSGIKVRLAVLQYAQLAKRRAGEDYWTYQDRIYNYRNDRTFADFVGNTSGDAMAMFAATVTRSAGRVDEVAAGTGIGYFKIVWDKSPSLGNAVWGGASTLPETIAARLGERVRIGARVSRVVLHPDHVEVRYADQHGEHVETARQVVMATIATVTHELLDGASPDLIAALSQIKYGPYVAGAFLTNEQRAVWDGSYGIAAPKRSFTIFTNQTSTVRTAEQAQGRPRGNGSSLFVFTATDWAHRLLGMDESEIQRTYLADLDQIFPGFSQTVTDCVIAKWHQGQTFNFPGRAKLQPVLTRDHGRLHLAGDYLGTLYTETAITTGALAGRTAAAKVRGTS
jgi:oxygen-dependent protoporphyrinogen oxidase